MGDEPATRDFALLCSQHFSQFGHARRDGCRICLERFMPESELRDTCLKETEYVGTRRVELGVCRRSREALGVSARHGGLQLLELAQRHQVRPVVVATDLQPRTEPRRRDDVLSPELRKRSRHKAHRGALYFPIVRRLVRHVRLSLVLC